jgi:hypothetical protein
MYYLLSALFCLSCAGLLYQKMGVLLIEIKELEDGLTSEYDL